LLLASAGIRLGSVSELRLRHLKKIPEYNLYKIIVYENTREEYYTFCTPECATAIDNYLLFCGSSLLHIVKEKKKTMRNGRSDQRRESEVLLVNVKRRTSISPSLLCRDSNLICMYICA
jgi:hypothetical protein